MRHSANSHYPPPDRVDTQALSTPLQSPIDVLPLEILCEIFVLYLWDTQDIEMPHSLSSPLLLSHVCSRWREAAISEPRLWRRLQLSQSKKRPGSLRALCKELERMADQALFWIQKAGEVGLELDVTLPPLLFSDLHDLVGGARFVGWDGTINRTYKDPTESWRKFTIPVLHQNSVHLRRSRLASTAAPMHFYAEKIEEFSKLESITLETPSNSPILGNIALGNLFSTKAPALKRAAILIPTIQPSKSLLELLPWSQLTHLMMTFPIPGSFSMHILARCPKLESCILHIDEEPEDSVTVLGLTPPPVSGTPLELTQLDHLDVTFYAEYSSGFFEDFRFSRLKSFVVAQRDDLDDIFPPFPWLPPSPAQNRLFGQLRSLVSLTLSYQDITAPRILDLLAQVHDLEELSLDSSLLDHKLFLASMAFNYGGKELLVPKLRLFRFVWVRNELLPLGTFGEDFLAMIVSRSERACEILEDVSNQSGLLARDNYYHSSVLADAMRSARMICAGGTTPLSLQHVELQANYYDIDPSDDFSILRRFEEDLERDAFDHSNRNGPSIFFHFEYSTSPELPLETEPPWS